MNYTLGYLRAVRWKSEKIAIRLRISLGEQLEETWLHSPSCIEA